MCTSSSPQPDCANLLLIKGNQVERIRQEAGKDNIVEVKATAEMRLPLDRAVVSIQVQSSKENAKDAKISVDRRISYILQTLRINAIKDVETVSHLQRNQTNFTMTTQVTAKFTDLPVCFKVVNVLAEKLDRTVTITEPEFYLSTESLQAAKKEVCIKAAQIAREKAHDLARVFSAKLGKLISLREDQSVITRTEFENVSSDFVAKFKNSLNVDVIMCQSQIIAKFELSMPVKKSVYLQQWY